MACVPLFPSQAPGHKPPTPPRARAPGTPSHPAPCLPELCCPQVTGSLYPWWPNLLKVPGPLGSSSGGRAASHPTYPKQTHPPAPRPFPPTPNCAHLSTTTVSSELISKPQPPPWDCTADRAHLRSLSCLGASPPHVTLVRGLLSAPHPACTFLPHPSLTERLTVMGHSTVPVEPGLRLRVLGKGHHPRKPPSVCLP